jgi:hypothetical protein
MISLASFVEIIPFLHFFMWKTFQILNLYYDLSSGQNLLCGAHSIELIHYVHRLGQINTISPYLQRYHSVDGIYPCICRYNSTDGVNPITQKEGQIYRATGTSSSFLTEDGDIVQVPKRPLK